MIQIETRGDTRIDRRTFCLLAANLALAAGVSAQGPQLETLTQWLAASQKMRDGALQPCIDRIRSLDGDIQAWVQVLPQKPTGNGALRGIPFGVKDIIETRGLATEYGSPIYKGRIGTADAAIVRQLRQRGGVLLGKTHTTAFAYTTPAPTHNPRNLAHTPGGSSSGSAAAVAAGMVPARHRYPDRRIGRAAGVLLRRDRIQGQLRPAPDGRSAAVREEPRHARILHTHGRGHARLLGSDGVFDGSHGRYPVGCVRPHPRRRAGDGGRVHGRARAPAWRRRRDSLRGYRPHAGQAPSRRPNRHVLRGRSISRRTIQAVRRSARGTWGTSFAMASRSRWTGTTRP